MAEQTIDVTDLSDASQEVKDKILENDAKLKALDNTANLTPKEWYLDKFPTDDMGKDIPETLTWDAIKESMEKNDGYLDYNLLGSADDSIVRERLQIGLDERNLTGKEISYIMNGIDPSDAPYLENMQTIQREIDGWNERFEKGMIAEVEKEQKIAPLQKSYNAVKASLDRKREADAVKAELKDLDNKYRKGMLTYREMEVKANPLKAKLSILEDNLAPDVREHLDKRHIMNKVVDGIEKIDLDEMLANHIDFSDTDSLKESIQNGYIPIITNSGQMELSISDGRLEYDGISMGGSRDLYFKIQDIMTAVLDRIDESHEKVLEPLDLAEALTREDAFNKADEKVREAFNLGFSERDVNEFFEGHGFIGNLYRATREAGLLAPDYTVLGDNPDITLGDMIKDMNSISGTIINELSTYHVESLLDAGHDAIDEVLRNTDYDFKADDIDYQKIWDIFYDTIGMNLDETDDRYGEFKNWIEDNVDTILKACDIDYCSPCITDDILTGYIGNVPANLEIPEGVKELGDKCLANNETVKTVKCPSTLEYIGESALEGCKNLKHVEFNKGLDEIGSNALKGCSNVQELNFPDTLQTIGSHAFEGIEGIKEVSIPDSVISVGNEAFTRCPNLEKVEYDSSKTHIGVRAFSVDIIDRNDEKQTHNTKIEADISH